MYKVAPTYYDGQSLVLLSDLPNKQCNSIGKWIGNGNIISISVDGKSFHECIRYEDYELWYRNYFQIDGNSLI